MTAWFESLAPRERIIVLIGAILTVVILAWRLVWMPLDARAAALTTEVSQQSRLLVDLKRAADLGAASSGSRAGAGASSPLAIVDQTARPFGLSSTFSGTRAEGPDAIYITFRDSPFDTLNSWLTLLETEYGMSVVTVSGISASAIPGLVNGQMLLARS